ncbi:polysaccharide deacetylase family protein [Leucobacter sp. M11]|uniref:polysaccharide deacetylase family protein n=1 Tax=Leucobacter sp. M11 TaxID=2993565 RepID=UPI002D7E22B4|nr:polysaccharide deacetylase [Leucobacter sp. M11]MEB4614715.1 polysaccharide deacetylase [Leucobacter sp. M11]
MAKDIRVCFGVDIDAVAGWLGSYGGQDSPNDIQRGVYAGKTGTPRLLKLFERAEIRASWFIPGHSLETFPDECRMVFDHGHEIGAHGYAHENPIAMTPAQEDVIMEKSVELIEKLTGQAPRGYVAPWWELSEYTPTLLQKFGFQYDHSQSHQDFVPFYARVGDAWTKIDYEQHPETWMRPMTHGSEIDLVEIGANWYLDDLPPMMFMKASPNSHGFMNPRDIEDMWFQQFEWVHRELDYAVFPITIHPDVSGRPQVLMMLERLIEKMRGYEGVTFVTMEEAVAEYRSRFPFAGTERPRDY